MIEAIRRFLIRREIRRWNVMHAKYLLERRAENEERQIGWPDYRTKVWPTAREIMEDLCK